jgi:ABC-2 type transport system ATP-binding protein
MLEIAGLAKAYGDVVALDDCSLSVSPGRMLGFLGPNGAGKTTAMRAVFGLIAPDRGTVTWHGHSITAEDRLRFGYMPETRGLYPKMRAADQLAYLGALHGLEAAASRASADQWLERLGLAERANDPVEKLSHGNQQRVQLAAALVHSPDLLVLDEPFSGLDPIGVETMAAVLRERADAGSAVLFSSHQLDLVEDLCEEVAIINKGNVVMSGNVDQIKDASPVRHLEIEIADGDEALIANLNGVIRSETNGRRHRLLIDAKVDVRSVLHDALTTGQIRRFIYSTPSLSEIFLEAVT